MSLLPIGEILSNFGWRGLSFFPITAFIFICNQKTKLNKRRHFFFQIKTTDNSKITLQQHWVSLRRMRNYSCQFQATNNHDYLVWQLKKFISTVVNGKTGKENYENWKFKNSAPQSHIFIQLGYKHWRETFEREILKGVNGEGLDVVDEFLGNPIYAFFLLLMLQFGVRLCLGIWGFAIPWTHRKAASKPIHLLQ